MKLTCNVIRDLLPLYADGICSEETRALVSEHVAECSDCSVYLQQIQDTEIETDLRSETEKVILHQTRFFKRKSAVIGAAISAIFMIPILVCLIVNLSTGAALDWFFIVLASLITAASLIVVPLMMPQNKLLWTLGTFTASLIFLLGVICIYTHGKWFFLVTQSVLFGISVCFLPFVVYAKPVRARLGCWKGLIVMAADTLFFILMMLSIGLYTNSSDFFQLAPAIAGPILVVIWVLFVLIRYARLGGLYKAGISMILVGTFSFFADYLTFRLLGEKISLPEFHPFSWRVDAIDGNIKWLVLLGCLVAGIVCFGIGAAIGKHGNKPGD